MTNSKRVYVIRYFECEQTDFFFTRESKCLFVPNCYADDFIDGLKKIGVEVCEIRGDSGMTEMDSLAEFMRMKGGV